MSNASYVLINKYLEDCLLITEKILDKAIKTSTLSVEENKLAKEVSHVANVLSAIYFYRQDTDLENILCQMPYSHRQTLEPSMSIVWKHLLKLDEEGIAQLAFETIQASSIIKEQVSKELNII